MIESEIDVFADQGLFTADMKSNSYTDEFMKMVLDSIKAPEIGKTFEATVSGEDSNDFLLECGFKDLIRVPKTREEKNFFESHETGDKISVLITGISDSGEYSINGSVASIYREEAFGVLKRIKDDEYVSVNVNKLTPAGYTCKILMNGCEIDAFLPQVLAGVNKIHDSAKEDLVKENFSMCIEGYAYDKGTWIVSRRKYLTQLIPSYIEELEKDKLYTGVVTGSQPFGVFVEFFDCLTGMIHRTNLSEETMSRFDSINPGDPIEFYVKEIIYKKDKKTPKLILTQVNVKSLWDNISIGQTIDGVIKEHKSFGTLIKLDHETNGLIHTSEQTPDVESMESGEEIKVKVLAVDRSQRKIYLRKTED